MRRNGLHNSLRQLGAGRCSEKPRGPARRSVPAAYNTRMRVMALQSGSNGNAIYVEAAGVRLLIDAGISGVQMHTRLAAHGIDARQIDALLISHEHRDHSRCLGVYHRKYGIPVYATSQTLTIAHRLLRLGTLDDVRVFRSGASLSIGAVTVETIPTYHDSADGVGFVIDDSRRRVGVLTDLGHAFPGLRDAINSLDAVLIESNYDPDMLQNGPYPEFLKQRIRGQGGHLSNPEAAELLAEAFRGRLQWAVLGHLSEHNNHPQLALRTHHEILGNGHALSVAGRYEASPMFTLDH